MSAPEVRWAGRVSRGKIRRLYESYSRGIVDGELLDEVGFGLLARCQSILTVKAAKEGRVTCPGCGQVVPRRRGRRDDPIVCERCGWETSWFAYRKSFLRRQLNHGGAADVFVQYSERFPAATSPDAKMRLIDWLIHECHKVRYVPDGNPSWVRPVATNLIDGTMEELLVFLDELAYGDTGTPEAKAAWRERLEEGRKTMMESVRQRRQR